MRVALQKKTSTKAERIFAEMLKRNRIPFLHRSKIEGKEIDFIVGSYAVEIDGHAQSSTRNDWLVKKGLTPLHFSNSAVRENLEEIERNFIQKLKK